MLWESTHNPEQEMTLSFPTNLFHDPLSFLLLAHFISLPHLLSLPFL